MESQEKARLVEYDILRIIACFSVVMLHCAAQSWYYLPVTDTEWPVVNAYDAIFRFGVPVFVMISGALFLNSDRALSLKKLYLHNILRMVIIYLVWSVAYGLFNCRKLPLQYWSFDVLSKEIMSNRYHLWYLPMIIGIYMLLPILKTWIKNATKREIEYFLLLFVICQVLKETLTALSKQEIIKYTFGIAQVYMVCGYLGYFVLGYYIAHYRIEKKWHKWIYVAGIIGAVANPVLGNILALRAGEPLGEIYDSFGIFTFLISTALFVFATEILGKCNYSKRAGKWIRELALATFGVYLLHVGMIEFLATFDICVTMTAVIVGTPLLALITFVICTVLSAVLRRIPFVGRYIC